MFYILLGIAGALGALLRYFLGIFINSSWDSVFPLETLLTNYLGCFALGYFTTRISKLPIHPNVLKAIGTGLIGSFTTFSTFSVETITMLRENYLGFAFTYIMFSLIGGLITAGAGYRIGELSLQRKEKRKELT